MTNSFDANRRVGRNVFLVEGYRSYDGTQVDGYPYWWAVYVILMSGWRRKIQEVSGGSAGSTLPAA